MESKPHVDELARAEVARSLENAFMRLGLDLTHPDLKGTPDRLAELWFELFGGLDPENAPTLSPIANADASAGMASFPCRGRWTPWARSHALSRTPR